METDAPNKEYEELYFSSTKEIIFFELWVDKINTHGKKDKRLLKLSESGAYLYKPRTFSKENVLSRGFSWFDISKISLQSNDTLELQFVKGEITFVHNTVNEILQKVICHIFCILREEERPILSIGNFDVSTIQLSSVRSLLRFRAKVINEGLEINQAIIQCYRGFYISNSQSFNFNGAEDISQPYVGCVLDSFILENNIKSIEISNNEYPSHWKELSLLLDKINSIESIITHEKFDEYTCNLIHSLQSTSSPVHTFGFIDTNVKNEQFQTFVDIIKTRKIQTLIVSNTMTRLKFKNFLNEIESTTILDDLKELRVNKISGLAVLTSTQACRHIKTLSFTNCDSEISSFFKSMSKAVGYTVENLDISGNISSTHIPKGSRLQPSIRRFAMNNTKLAAQCFGFLLHSFSKSPTIAISMDNLEITPSEYISKAFSVTHSITIPGMTELHWNNNPVMPEFFDLLDRSGHVRILSIDNFTSPENVTEDLCDFIAVNDYIEDLSMRGHSYILDVNGIRGLIKAIGENRAIKRLALSGRPLDESQLADLATALCSNCVMEHIEIRNIGEHTANEWRSFFATVTARGAPLKVEFDLPEDGADIQELAAAAAHGNADIDVPEEALIRQNFDRAPRYRTAQKEEPRRPARASSMVVDGPPPLPGSIPAHSDNSATSSHRGENEEEEDEPSAESEVSGASPVLSGLCVPAVPTPDISDTLKKLEARFSISEIVGRIRQNDR